jgi:biopolymer transport protein ExbD
MIDVMFFLLATFILASLSLQNLHSLPVNLPRGKSAPIQARTPITLTITKENSILIDSTPVTLDDLAATLRPLLKDLHKEVIVAADSVAPEGTVVQAMLKARSVGVEHFLIAVKYNE